MHTAMAEETAWQQALHYANRANPYPFYAELRKTPVSRQPDGSYVVSTYREITALLHDPRVSSDPRHRDAAAVHAAYPSVEPSSATARTPSMITSDPPDHDRVRRVAMWHFGPPHTPELVASQEPEIQRIATGLLDKLASKTRIDIVDEFAYPLPVTVICEILGVPTEDEPRFHAWIEAGLDGLDLGPEAASEEQLRRLEVGRQSVAQLQQYMTVLVDHYAERPGPGLLSAIVNHVNSDERMSRAELVSNAMLMLFAGHETTVNLIAHSILTVLRYPDVLDTLRRRPELVVPGIEEFLRFESSVQFWPTRTALEDIEIAGTRIPKGASIIVVYGSANRDPDRFTNPDEVDLEREDNQHLGFSSGIHLCFGGPLARLEAQIAVGEFIRRVENPRLVVDPPPYRRNQIFRGPRHLLVDIEGVRRATDRPVPRQTVVAQAAE
jgi:cytochrome P450